MTHMSSMIWSHDQLPFLTPHCHKLFLILGFWSNNYGGPWRQNLYKCSSTNKIDTRCKSQNNTLHFCLCFGFCLSFAAYFLFVCAFIFCFTKEWAVVHTVQYMHIVALNDSEKIIFLVSLVPCQAKCLSNSTPSLWNTHHIMFLQAEED